MSNRPKDRLDDFVKKKIDLDLENQKAWNTPPDEVFFNAMEELDDNNSKKKNRFFIILFSSLFLLSTFSYLIIEKSRLNELSENMDQVKVELDQLNNELIQEKQINQQNNSVNNTNQNKEVASNNALVRGGHPENINDIQKSKNLNSIASNEQTKSIQKAVNNPIKNFTASSNSGFQKASNTSISKSTLRAKPFTSKTYTTLEKSTLARLMLLDKLNLSPLVNEREVLTLDHLQFIEYVLGKNDAKTSPFTFGVFLNQNLTSLTMDPNSTGSTSTLTNYDRFYYGKGITSQLSYDISSHFYIALGLSYNDYSNSSVFQNQELYAKANEYSNTSGDFTYIDDMNIETPFGNYQTEMSFDVDPNQTSNDDIIERTSTISQNFKVLETALNIGYKTPLSNKFDWYVETGLNYNFLFGLENEMQTEVILNDELRCRMTDISEGMPDLNSGFFGVQVGTGIEYRLKGNVNLNFGLTHLKSLNSLRQINSTTDPSLDLTQFQIKLGSQYRF